jgi:DNA polymerase-1
MPAALRAENLSSRMLLQVHDELVFEAIDAEVDRTMAVAKAVMEKAPEPAFVFNVPIKVDARAAHNWEAAH